MIGAIGAALIIGGVLAISMGVGVGVGMAVSASEAADAAKYAADRASEAQKFSAEQQRLASDHEADLLFKTEQADRELSVKFNDDERSEEAQMMKMFGMIDDIEVDEAVRVDRRGSSRERVDLWGDYETPTPCDDGDLTFS